MPLSPLGFSAADLDPFREENPEAQSATSATGCALDQATVVRKPEMEGLQ